MIWYGQGVSSHDGLASFSTRTTMRLVPNRRAQLRSKKMIVLAPSTLVTYSPLTQSQALLSAAKAMRERAGVLLS